MKRNNDVTKFFLFLSSGIGAMTLTQVLLERLGDSIAAPPPGLIQSWPGTDLMTEMKKLRRIVLQQGARPDETRVLAESGPFYDAKR